MKMNRLFLLAALAFGQQAHANLVTNGSFESGAFVANLGQGTMIVPGGNSTTITGWTVNALPLAWINSPNPWGLAASDGSFFLDLTGGQTGAPYSGVSQTIATTPGTVYNLSFDLGSSNLWGRPSAIQVTATGNGQLHSSVYTSSTTGTDNDWDQVSFQFVADSATTAIAFVGSAGVNYIGLDNVAVNAVPVPAAVWLLGSALGGLGFARRRRA